MDTAPALAGWRVLVTRPEAQAGPLCERLAAAGAEPVPFPVMEIRFLNGVRWPAPLDSFDYALFVSVNAVTAFRAQAAGAGWPAGVKTLAIGRQTAAAMTAAGIPVSLAAPSPFTSEALLALPDLQRLADCSIVILRGRGGRELIRDTLCQRGARVEALELYERRLPEADSAALLQRWHSGGIDAVLVTSNAILDNLLELLGEAGRELLRRTPLIVPSERTRAYASRQGCEQVRVADNATDAAMVAALARLAADRASAHHPSGS
ncbi:uroporphyrinogen-III synthase [Thiohalobacter thiocyanaticus]|uniref:Uroporphyrinogen-III synthase n=1 Tax=Thiohalobacter thiocyanaticus TaxID=585455 RepID=A0A1Z4VM86_9GAMM|nr:uroporphyrinogen-III synthase [Thiohalobacter thiocyanaticus]BAZ92730.1 uroporphyrinogen-III synthase [Thiohalobacter thiocyanaticus]